MVAPMYRSRSKKRRQVRTPGGKTVTHYKRKKPKENHCGRCGKPLQGVPNYIPSEMKELGKSEKVPERPYAGVLCTGCVEKLIRYKTRFEVKSKYPEFKDLDVVRDLTIEKFLPAAWWDGLQKD
jgi:large subunit ribosomal protein L34e